MKATDASGNLLPIKNCYIKAFINGIDREVKMYILPDISDSKQANYSDETGVGRSAPLKVFSHGETRSISWAVHFFSDTKQKASENLDNLRILESLVYPDESSNSIVSPPPIARIKCGILLGETELCVVLKGYSVKFPTDVAWQDIRPNSTLITPISDVYMPIKFDVDLTFEVVYQTINLPGAKRILQFGG